jgi:Rieske Fe-S protein
VTDIPVGGGVIVSEPPVVLTQPTAGDVKAFTSICPHQGCKVSEVSNNEIYCPCHGSKFSALDGSVIQGPATEGLSAAAVAVDGTKVSFG